MPKTIVWVDDDNDLLDSLIEPLKWVGHTVICFRTVQEARAAIELIRSADLLLLDMILPTGGDEVGSPSHYTGLELLRELRGEGVRVPAIVLTLVAQARGGGLFRELKELGAVDVIHKPVLPSELKAAVDRVLSSY